MGASLRGRFMVRRTNVSTADSKLIVQASPEVVLPEEDVVRPTPEQAELDKRIIRGKFHFYERPGGMLDFGYGGYTRGDKIINYQLVDGRTYDLPWGVVRHLEESSYYMSHNIEVDSNASDRVVVQGGEQEVYSTVRGHARFAFMPVV